MSRVPLHRRAPALLAAALTASLVACAPATPPATTGALELSVSTAAGVLPGIVRVQATLSGPILPQIVYDLVQGADGSWSTRIDALPPGAIHVEVGAFEEAGALAYTGRGDTTVVAGQVAGLQIFAQEVKPPPSYGNNPPRIDAIGVSSLSVLPGTVVSLNVTAVDVDPGATLTYLWRASSGTIADPAAPTTQWTAPAAPGAQTIFVTVRDEQGAAAEASFEIRVIDPSSVQGSIALSVTLNRMPVVTTVTVSPSRVEPGAASTVAATVVDPDGDAVALRWTSTCPGSFGNAASATTTFTPAETPVGGLCRVQLYADDGHGGSATGWSGLWIGPPPQVGTPNPPPPPPTGSGFVNGSFESRDFQGWTLLAFSESPLPGPGPGQGSGSVFGIGRPGEEIVPGQPVLDYLTGAIVTAESQLLPQPIFPMDGQFSAFQIPNSLGTYRLLQTLTVTAAMGAAPRATFLLAARSLVPWRPGSQSVSVNIRDAADRILATPFMLDPGLPLDLPPEPVEIDLTPFVGQTIVFDVQIDAMAAPIAVELDGFKVR